MEPATEELGPDFMASLAPTTATDSGAGLLEATIQPHSQSQPEQDADGSDQDPEYPQAHASHAHTTIGGSVFTGAVAIEVDVEDSSRRSPSAPDGYVLQIGEAEDPDVDVETEGSSDGDGEAEDSDNFDGDWEGEDDHSNEISPVASGSGSGVGTDVEEEESGSASCGSQPGSSSKWSGSEEGQEGRDDDDDDESEETSHDEVEDIYDTGNAKQDPDPEPSGAAAQFKGSSVLEELQSFQSVFPDAIADHFLASAGFECSDPRIPHLISLAAQKYLIEILKGANTICKAKAAAAAAVSGVVDSCAGVEPDGDGDGGGESPTAYAQPLILTLEDLEAAARSKDQSITLPKLLQLP